VTPLVQLEFAAASFVGSHFLLSHPLRRPLVGALGERGFQGLYSLVALATLGWMIVSARAIGPEAPRWDPGQAGAIAGSLLMWLGSILFAGSFAGNPALPSGSRGPRIPAEPRGVFRITRHPMMWGFGLWALTHFIVNSTPSGLVIAEAIFVLAIFGAALQDYKKRRLVGSAWRQWERKAPFFPFTRGLAAPGWFAFIAGTILFLVATWAHGALGYRMAGPWALLG
jgi:uncharacterized membrane protein